MEDNAIQITQPKNTCKIEWMRVYENGKVEVLVECNSCKRKNTHYLHSTHKNSLFVQIDFDKLGARCCPSMNCQEYKLYQ
jgi:hypothetical protein